MVVVRRRFSPTHAMVIVGCRFEHRRTAGVAGCHRKMAAAAPTENTMRGIDFYPWKDFIRALIHGAHMFKAENGYLPRLASPTTFNEHMFVRKFFAPMPMPSLADKLAAKEHVKDACRGRVSPRRGVGR